MKQVKTAEEILSELALPFKPTECNFRLPIIIEAMQTYAQQLKPEWTAVEDNPPFHNDEQASESALIGALIGKHWSVIGSAHYFKGTWYYDHNGEEVPYKITHYIFYSSLPLPSLPNQKQ